MSEEKLQYVGIKNLKQEEIVRVKDVEYEIRRTVLSYLKVATWRQVKIRHYGINVCNYCV